ncbi:hypothetical protein Verru16b_00071 [Lacunisphaera limnophila]|uniref:Cytochrome C Planctomycete-type domain-containing protein n=1 Tax=Lacunisphaera limnophila TaxID=1838286 RepID=A0A1I7PHF4_9BACT|nr:hypothetical protein [Lacunisphaera limnophila]AOS43033.1 hypothetical protein Verru16b_00071 [Lacunisphaera limnophila]
MKNLLTLATLLTLAASRLSADAVVDSLLPLKPEVRKVINESCVMCHGEVIDGEKEIRDDLDYSTDDAIRATLANAGKLKQVVLEDKMPHKPRLSRRLRNNVQLQERLTALRANYDAAGHKAILLDWLKDVTATTGGDKKE